jgi:hypothetical protein
MNGDDAAAERAREAAGWLAIAREDLRVAGACLASSSRSLVFRKAIPAAAERPFTDFSAAC